MALSGAKNSGPGAQARVRTIRHLPERFCLPVGYSGNNSMDKLPGTVLACRRSSWVRTGLGLRRVLVIGYPRITPS